MAGNEPAKSGIFEFWTTYGPAITGGAVIVSALCAIIVIITNRLIARRRATLDLILHIESDGDLLEARNALIDIKKSNVKSSTWGTEAQRDSAEAKAIRTVLNINELIAVSIAEGVIDERVYRRWFNRAFIDDYRSMAGYIESVREYRKNPAIFKELECLAKQWEADPHFYAQPGWLIRKARAVSKVWIA